MMINIFDPLFRLTDKELQEKIGKDIQKLRLQLRLSQEELAKRAGISRSQLAKIENSGKTTLLTLIGIAKGLRVLKELTEVFETEELTLTDHMRIKEFENKIIQSKPKRIRK